MGHSPVQEIGPTQVLFHHSVGTLIMCTSTELLWSKYSDPSLNLVNPSLMHSPCFLMHISVLIVFSVEHSFAIGTLFHLRFQQSMVSWCEAGQLLGSNKVQTENMVLITRFPTIPVTDGFTMWAEHACLAPSSGWSCSCFHFFRAFSSFLNNSAAPSLRLNLCGCRVTVWYGFI